MQFDNIVISPGPGHPANSTDMGVSRAAIRHSKVPLLGVCLGHQAIGLECGARLIHVPELIHGRTSAINHGGEGLFEGVPSPTAVARYHSYVIVDPVPSSLFVTARSEDGLVMAVAHATRALWGVQFHPESIITDCGRKIIENFRDMTRAAA
jgi:anthranilate synthase/aminodeoxychorismate synthase-like glutamine amidotransferase